MTELATGRPHGGGAQKRGCTAFPVRRSARSGEVGIHVWSFSRCIGSRHTHPAVRRTLHRDTPDPAHRRPHSCASSAPPFSHRASSRTS
ncbi:hypothetical protein AAFF_G00046280 [Aldrovandia affinis]|uniref:Uncharacterized protein n=1 Tax=Aldrovandia affinis TaxID=143900 RepID=A0AAD7S291_9TELE|nr:hypothetical protein AAFF_G00046280 [Aldrovandia affinis]